MTHKPRTTNQNSALHLAMQNLSDALNDAGYSVMEVMKHDAEIPWSPVLVKELLYKKIMKVYTGKDSTTQLTTKELSEVYEILTKHMTLVDVIHDGCGARFEINIKDLKNYSGDRFARTTDGKCPVCHHYSKQYQLTVIRVNELRNQYATKIHNQ